MLPRGILLQVERVDPCKDKDFGICNYFYDGCLLPFDFFNDAENRRD